MMQPQPLVPGTIFASDHCTVMNLLTVSLHPWMLPDARIGARDEEGHGKGPASSVRNRWSQPSHGSCSCTCLEIAAKCQFSLCEALKTCLLETTFHHNLHKLHLEW